MITIYIRKKFVLLFSLFVSIIWFLGRYSILKNSYETEEIYINQKSKFNKWQQYAIHEEKFKQMFPHSIQPIGYNENCPGEMGKAVIFTEAISEDIRNLIEDGWRKNSFNQYVSDLISVQRSIPDPRDEWCKEPYRYDIKLPKTSVIICFHNEAWSVLLRSIYSILNRSPPHLIEEIILVDDFSDMEHLKQPLVDYWITEPKVKIIRNKKREGFIRSRLVGNMHAKGEILTFLDSHIEAATGWLEPLLDRIKSNYTTVVCPVIDTIRHDNFEFLYGKKVYVGGFDWNLLFTWHAIPKREEKRRYDYAEPVYSPTIAGGLFSISKKFFEEIGTYDDGFEIWGAENLELSFKTWMCGGSLEIVPCSHIGHVFRESLPYRSSSGNSSTISLRKKLRRLAEVWLDDYKYYYYLRSGEPDTPIGDITSRRDLRKNLGCKSFQWFLDNVYPELYIPNNIQGSGFIGSNYLCLDSSASTLDIYEPLPAKTCIVPSDGGSQFWYYSNLNEIRKEEACIDYDGDKNIGIILYPCHGKYGTQQWDYDPQTGLFYHPFSQGCLRISKEYKLEVVECDPSDSYQKWIIEHFHSAR